MLHRQKRVTLVLLLGWISALGASGQSSAISTGRIDSLKDSWGEYFDYTGDIRNKQPNGLGVAHYDGSYALWYGGYFVDGQFDGKGVLMFKDGFFLSGNWKAGKLNGSGVSLNKDKNFYVGEFKDGTKHGKGTYIFTDNSIVVGNFRNDKYDGRCIYINSMGNIISDNIYQNNEKNGPGYQYELGSNKLYKGNWQSGEWLSATNGSYNSFLCNKDFRGKKTSEYILMGSVNEADNYVLYDSSFYYNLALRKKYFGIFNAGFLQNGVIVNDDTSVFMGSMTQAVAKGFGSHYKVGRFYDEGIYENNFLSGPACLTIDLLNLTLYFGGVTNNGAYTGKAWFVSKEGTLYNGNYENSKFTGYGSKLSTKGLNIIANWDRGKIRNLESVYDYKGQRLNLKPVTMTEVISMMSRLNEDDMLMLVGDEETEWTNDDANTVFKSFFNLPGTEVTYIVDDFDYFISSYSIALTTDNFTEAAKRYESLCTQVKNARPTIEAGAKPVFMVGETVRASVESEEYQSIYKPAQRSKHYDTFSVSVRLTKNDYGAYEVSIVFGPEDNLYTY
jgi:hypothetical protein